MKRMEIGVSLLLALLFMLVIFSTAGMTYWSEATPGPSFFPLWISGIGIVLAGVVIWLSWSDPRERELDWPDLQGTIRVGLIYLATWLVVASALYIGFLVSATLFCLVFLLGLMRAKLLPSLITTIIIIAILRILFVGVLDLQLPKGPLGF